MSEQFDACRRVQFDCGADQGDQSLVTWKQTQTSSWRPKIYYTPVPQLQAVERYRCRLADFKDVEHQVGRALSGAALPNPRP